MTIGSVTSAHASRPLESSEGSDYATANPTDRLEAQRPQLVSGSGSATESFIPYGFCPCSQRAEELFPKSFWVALAAQIVKPLAVWIVKSALRDAASDIGITLNDETLTFLSQLAVDALLAA